MGWSKSKALFLQVLVKGTVTFQEETGHTISCPLAPHLQARAAQNSWLLPFLISLQSHNGSSSPGRACQMQWWHRLPSFPVNCYGFCTQRTGVTAPVQKSILRTEVPLRETVPDFWFTVLVLEGFFVFVFVYLEGVEASG